MKRQFFLIPVLVSLICCDNQISESETDYNFRVIKDIQYKKDSPASEYEYQRCKLDLYLPEGVENYPVLVWFHGGSLKRGSKDDEMNINLAERFAGEGMAVALVNYRLAPEVVYPAYVDDAAASVAWVINNISEYGGNPESVFIGGHSAGAYQVLMLALAEEFLGQYGKSPHQVAGVIAVSGQTFTHYTVRKERGIKRPERTAVIDDASPCYHAKSDTPPLFFIWADGDTESRIQENKALISLLRKAGNNNIVSREIADRNHWRLIRMVPDEDDPLSLVIKGIIHND